MRAWRFPYIAALIIWAMPLTALADACQTTRFATSAWGIQPQTCRAWGTTTSYDCTQTQLGLEPLAVATSTVGKDKAFLNFGYTVGVTYHGMSASGPWTYNGITGAYAQYRFQRPGYSITSISIYVMPYGDECPPDPCDSAPSEVFINSPVDEGVTTICHDSCTYTYVPGTSPRIQGTKIDFAFTKQLTGSTCSGDNFAEFLNQNTQESTPNLGNDGICGPTASGGEICFYHSGAKDNCGEYNGQQICVPDMPDAGQCSFLGAGGYICDTTAQDKPKADGVDMTPDATVQNGGKTTEVFSDAAVDTSDNIGDGTSTAPVQALTAQAIGDAVAGALQNGIDVNVNIPPYPEPYTPTEIASAIEQTTAASADGKANADNSGYGLDTIHDEFWTSIEGSPIASVADNIGQSWPAAGQCPTYQVDLFGETLTMDMHCDLMLQIGSILSAAFLVLYSLIGIRILMSS